MPDFNRKLGPATMPAIAAGESTLASLDPGRDIMLDLFRVALNADLGARWALASTGTPLAGTQPVQDAHPAEPTKAFIQSTKTAYPVLFLYPDDQPTFKRMTVRKNVMHQTWRLEYLLGPLSPSDARKLDPALRYFAKLVNQVVKMGGHPAYAMDQNDVWPDQVLTTEGEGYAGFTSVEVKDGGTLGSASFEGSAGLYYGATMLLETVEEDGFAIRDYLRTRHAGADFALGGDEAGTLEWMTEIASEIPVPDE